MTALPTPVRQIPPADDSPRDVAWTGRVIPYTPPTVYVTDDGYEITDPTVDETGQYPVGPDYYKGRLEPLVSTSGVGIDDRPQ